MIVTVKRLVDRGIELRSIIAKHQEELEKVEEGLIELAKLGEQVPLADADREGKQFLAEGSEAIVPVVFTADKIIGQFADGSQDHIKIGYVAGTMLSRFYKRTIKYVSVPKNGKAFRALCDELLGQMDAPKMVTACLARDKDGIPKSDIKIEWAASRPAQLEAKA